jgi:hypothetical protein
MLIYQISCFLFYLVISVTSVLGQEFQVNDNTDDNDQIRPRIACDGNINFIVVWQDMRNGNWDIYGQLYDCRGTKRGSNFRVNPATDYGDQCSPSVAVDGNGNFVIVWRDDGRQSIYGQCFYSNGTKRGNSFQISESLVPSYENETAIAMRADGTFVVVWQNSNLRLCCQRYDNGGNKLGSNFLVDEDQPFLDQYYPDIAMDENGNFMVAWGTYIDVYCKKFGYDGVSRGSTIRVTEPVEGYQSDPRIIIDGNGNYVIVWEDARNGRYSDVYGQRISSTGMLIGPNFKVNEIIEDTNQAGAAIAVNRVDNIFIVAWDDYRNGLDDDGDIYCRFFSSDAQPTGHEMRVNQDSGKKCRMGLMLNGLTIIYISHGPIVVSQDKGKTFSPEWMSLLLLKLILPR